MKWQVVCLIVLVVLLFGQIGIFYLFAITCSYPDTVSNTMSDVEELQALVVSDVHLLGRRRRSWIERIWIDWQISMSVTSAIDIHKPDLVLVLGDQLDEGTQRTAAEAWKEYTDRFFSAFSRARDIPTLYLLGNHDSAFGKFLSPALVQRYESSFGPANAISSFRGHTFIQLNTMALDTDAPTYLYSQSKAFLDDIVSSDLLHPSNGSTILLSHLPFYRPNDLQCGPHRLREGGHITYEHPSFAYAEHKHVLSKSLSTEILEKLSPDIILSGHTHAQCSYKHDRTLEYTIPSFSWGQRPDPSYGLLSLSSHQVHMCSLPHEPHLFLLYITTFLVCIIISCKRRRRNDKID